MSNPWISYLQGGDLRTLGAAEMLLPLIKTQRDFNLLVACMHSEDRVVVMRAAHVMEKASRNKPEFLAHHKAAILEFMNTADIKHVKWHLAMMVSRLDLTYDEVGKVWDVLTRWAKDKKESRIVRTNAIQTLFDLVKHHNELQTDLKLTVQQVKEENIPSILARLRKLGA